VTSDLLAVAKCTGDYETLPVLLNADSGKVEREFPVGTPLIHNLSADLAGHYIAYSGGNIEGGPGVVVCSRTGERVLTRSEGQYISASCISPDGRFVAWSADSNRSLSVVEIPTGNMLDFGIRHAKTISAIAFNQSSSLIASGCLSGFVVVWSLSPPKRVAKFKVQQGVNDIAFTEDDRYLIVASTHPDVMIFD
jgi:WD40 repeat protein